ncbi:hypothetical protein ACLM5H_21975 [Fredinandcohnia humi]
MIYENVKLSVGTLSTVIIGIITILYEKNIHTIDPSEIQQFISFALIFLTVAITGSTGLLYFRNSALFQGFNYFLCWLLGLAHLLALILGIVAILKIEFGEYWLGMIALTAVVIYFASQNSNKDEHKDAKE